VKPDVLVDEIRAVRHRISAQFDHDTKALLDHYRKLEKKYRDRMVHKPRDASVPERES
jgi:hypothetical protein